MRGCLSTRWANYIHFVLVRLQKNNLWEKTGKGKTTDGRVISIYRRATEASAKQESRSKKRRSRSALNVQPSGQLLAPSGAILPPSHKPTPKWASILVQGANGRNRERGVTERFTLSDLIAIWDACNGRCAVSGMHFDSVVVGDGKAKRPFFPSLDRINRHRPYVRDNVRLVVSVANFAMNAWGLDPLIKLGAAVSDKHVSSESRNGEAGGGDLPAKNLVKINKPRRREKSGPTADRLATVHRKLGFPTGEILRDAVEDLTNPLILSGLYIA
jgi:hypothetical protein